jgi:hypothetical protein
MLHQSTADDPAFQTATRFIVFGEPLHGSTMEAISAWNDSHQTGDSYCRDKKHPLKHP